MLCNSIQSSSNIPHCLSQEFSHSLRPIVFAVGSVKHIVQCYIIEHDWSFLYSLERLIVFWCLSTCVICERVSVNCCGKMIFVLCFVCIKWKGHTDTSDWCKNMVYGIKNKRLKACFRIQLRLWPSSRLWTWFAWKLHSYNCARCI